MFFKQPVRYNWLVFILFFLTSLINYLIKTIGYPASKYFFVMIETSASKSEAFLKARCNSPFMLLLLYLLGIVGCTFTFLLKENSESVFYCTKEASTKWSVRASSFVIASLWYYYLNVTLFILRHYQWFIDFFFNVSFHCCLC